MAYEALDSLLQTLKQILKQSYHPDIDREIISIHDQAVFWQLHLQSNPEILEERIKKTTNETKRTIEYIFSGDNPRFTVWMKPAELLPLTQLREAARFFISLSIAGDAPHSIDRKRRRLGDISVSTSPTTRKYVVVSLDEDLKKIKYRLIDYSESHLQVISIVGMGGTGKTTLAKLVYNHKFIVDCFKIRVWLTASRDYSVGKILLDLGISVERNGLRDVAIQSLIRRHLEDKRFLIIIDDLSSKKTWDDLKMLFPDTSSGSRIMLTTRLHDVAAYANSSSPVHTMRLLDEHHGWELLKKKVFVDESCPIELEDVGKEIVKNCGGLPLSIVVVAGILSSVPKTRDSWMQIAANVGNLETIISMSYYLLPDYMRVCFLYMGGFPEDYEIRTSELVKLWIAEGFLKRKEEVANCLEDLVKRNLVSVSRRKYDGQIKGCSLHDMVRDFCITQAQREKIILSVVDYLPTPILRRHFLPRLLKSYGRISATWHDLHLKDSTHASLTHTIICFPQRGYKCKTCMHKFSLLRVFHVLHVYDNCEWEPTQLFDLIQLTYLAFSISTSMVPPTVSKLQNLQTLIIYRSKVVFPVEIWMLRQLRHLMALSFYLPPFPDGATIPLENLETMSLVMDFECSERIMEMIPMIKKLEICYPAGNDYCRDYHLYNLAHFYQLEKLRFESEIGRVLLKDVIFGLPASLKKLSLCHLRLPWNDMNNIGSLPNLQVLKLRNYACRGEYWETTMEIFKEMRVLLIDESNLKCWTSGCSNFRKLECLILFHCPNLDKLPEDIPTLKLIELDTTSSGPVLGFVENIKAKQQKYGNYGLEVRVKRY